MNKTADSNRKIIEKALLKLMKKNAYERISITDICREAGVSRTTFYHHFSKADDVLLSAYESAHEKAFGSHSWTIDYFKSDQFITDMIRFFDVNSDLLTALRHWDLLARISYLPTEKSLFSASEEKDGILAAYPAYTMIYFWGNYFSICSMWLRNGKKETPEQMFKIIRHMNSL
ncbi:MAG: TetR/AcrR family transcriptional regulator [Solobacterium sp.]|nr:TetR/AcrR family transcriptional regulator [Solobacterium sp.]